MVYVRTSTNRTAMSIRLKQATEAGPVQQPVQQRKVEQGLSAPGKQRQQCSSWDLSLQDQTLGAGACGAQESPSLLWEGSVRSLHPQSLEPTMI